MSCARRVGAPRSAASRGSSSATGGRQNWWAWESTGPGADPPTRARLCVGKSCLTTKAVRKVTESQPRRSIRCGPLAQLECDADDHPSSGVASRPPWPAAPPPSYPATVSPHTEPFTACGTDQVDRPLVGFLPGKSPATLGGESGWPRAADHPDPRQTRAGRTPPWCAPARGCAPPPRRTSGGPAISESTSNTSARLVCGHGEQAHSSS